MEKNCHKLKSSTHIQIQNIQLGIITRVQLLKLSGLQSGFKRDLLHLIKRGAYHSTTVNISGNQITCFSNQWLGMNPALSSFYARVTLYAHNKSFTFRYCPELQ